MHDATIPAAAATRLARRPIGSRSSAWAIALARAARRAGLRANTISLLSVLAAAGAAWLMLCPGSWLAWLGAAVCVQLRLLCNLLDGMVAIEGGQATAAGPLFNEVPDRAADTLLLVALGYAAGAPALGWAAGLLAIGTAYVRLLGGALGQAQDFSGIMAKPQRMAVLTIGLLAVPLGGGRPALLITAAAISAGSLITIATRLARLGRRLVP